MTDIQENNGTLKKDNINSELACTGCGAILVYKPGTQTLTCNYCGAANTIADSGQMVGEIDYEKFIREHQHREEKIDVVSLQCSACGAAVTLAANVTADRCPYCAANIVVKSGTTHTILKPQSLIPFEIEKKKAIALFKSWISQLWFAPSDLKRADVVSDRLNGIYIPYWTYDAVTHTAYTGERGTHYYVTETYTTEENGQTVTRTRQVQRTHWTHTSGRVHHSFDDILVIATDSLPRKYTEKLEPWNLSKLVCYNDKYLSGFRAETYRIDLTTGLDDAKLKMEPVIHDAVREDIGGDEQRIHTMDTAYANLTFKHILLPIWISSYRFQDKVYRFLVNGQTGEVQGERPFSVLKIVLTVLAVIAAIVMILLIL
ncbi:MAG: hypothetical protein ACM3SY_00185 [Candidatus Omnitrophota bacterium]